MRRYLQFVADHLPMLGFGFITIFWGNFGQSFFVSWYGAPIQASLGISATTYGSAYSFATLGSGLAIMAVGGFIDRWPLRRFLVVSALGLMCAALVLWQTYNLVTLLIGFFLVRLCGQGLLPHIAQTTMARQFEVNRGKALSLSASGVPFGEVVLPLAAVALIGVIGWQGSWLIIALGVPLVYLPLALWLLHLAQRRGQFTPYVQEKVVPLQPGQMGRRQMLTDRRFWLALPALMAGPFIVTGVFVQQDFILQQKGWTAAWLATCFIAYGLVHWFSQLVAGVLVDRFSARRVLPFMVAPLASAMLVAANLDGQWVALAFMSLMGVTIGASGTVSSALWAEVYGTARLGSIRSLVSSLMILSTATLPVLLGALIDAGQSVAQVLNLLGVAAVLAILLVSFSYRPD